MKGSESTLHKFFYNTKPLVVPVYQRNYTWKKENCKMLFDDILRISTTDKRHFIGSIVYVDHSDSCIIIDGQQRITTISILLLAIRNAILNGDITSDRENLVKKIEFEFLINQFSENEEHRMKLKPFREDSTAYDALFGDPANYVIESQITTNYLYFYDEIKAHQIEPSTFYDAIKNRLELVEIILNPAQGDNAQLVFETINSTGVSLNETDKIRNFVLMNLNAKMQEKCYNNYWLPVEQNTGIYLDDFMRDYLTMERKTIPNKAEVYRVFKEYVAEKYADGNEPLLEDLKNYSIIFKSIKEAHIGTPQANKIMTDLEQLELTTPYPFLLALLDYHKQGSISDKELEKVLYTLEVFLFRRIMSGYYNTGLNKIFANMHSRILKLQHDEYTYSDVFIYILQHGISYWDFPNDEDFRKSFWERDVYKMKSNYRLYLYYKLEEALNKETAGTKEKIENGTLSFEHIMPQTMTDDWKRELGEDFTEEDYNRWLHNIGNVTLTAYNSEYSNRKFSEKRDGIPNLPDMKGFKDSCVAMNKYVSAQEHWTLQQMQERSRLLAEEACKIWKYPVTDFKPIVIEEEAIPIDAEYKFTGRNIKSYVFEGMTVNVESWVDAFTRIVKTLYEKDGSILYHLAHDPSEVYYSTQEVKGSNKIADGIYLFVACDTNNKLRQIHRLLSMYKYESDDISVTLHPVKKTVE